MTDSAIKYVGVDGCKDWWIGVGLDGDGGSDVKVCEDFCDILEHFRDACVILVDMPIGLREDGKPRLRACDKEARWLLGEGWRSVFRVASRKFVEEAVENPDWGFGRVKKVKDRYNKAKERLNCRFEDDSGSFNSQEFYIIPKINEVDKVLSRRDKNASPKVRESHPEVCFLVLSEGHQLISTGKKTPLGFWERFKVLRHRVCNVGTILNVFTEVRRRGYKKAQVADDDILDALALALTAKIGSQNGFMTLPDDPSTDCKGQMVYALPNDEGTPC